jgi:hypothetical protein
MEMKKKSLKLEMEKKLIFFTLTIEKVSLLSINETERKRFIIILELQCCKNDDDIDDKITYMSSNMND